MRKYKVEVEEKMQTLVVALANVQYKIVALQGEQKKKEDIATENIVVPSTVLAKVESKLDVLEESRKKPAKK